jgi:hypothetical protein
MKLKGGLNDYIDMETAQNLMKNIGELNLQAAYGAFSMLIWGLIMAKAKTGYNAALSKDQTKVQGSWKNSLTILVLVALATFA